MVTELIRAGLTGRELHAEVARLTGLPPGDAAMLIAVETGRVAVPPQDPTIDAYIRERQRNAKP